MHLTRRSTLTLFGALLLASCGGDSTDSEAAGSDAGASAAAETAPAIPVVEVRAIYDAAEGRHLFETSASRVQAGWTTFRFTNASPMVHFVLLDHLPGDRTSVELLSEVSPIFQRAMDLVTEGKPDEANAAYADLPEWFGGIVFRGGPGFLSPGRTSETTVYLEPGNYVLECYVRTAEGVFHWNLGMYADLEVTPDATDAAPPAEPTLRVTVTDTALVFDREPTSGDHLVAVDFQEEAPGLIGRDVHVARLGPDGDVDAIVAWLDFNMAAGLISTLETPGPADFLGGAHDMPRGNTAYFTVTLEPGEYVFITEQPTETSLQRRFVVP